MLSHIMLADTWETALVQLQKAKFESDAEGNMASGSSSPGSHSPGTSTSRIVVSKTKDQETMTDGSCCCKEGKSALIVI